MKRATGGPAELFRLTNNAGGYIGLEDGSVAAGDNTGRIWNMQNIAGEYRITTAPPGGGAEKELVLDAMQSHHQWHDHHFGGVLLGGL